MTSTNEVVCTVCRMLRRCLWHVTPFLMGLSLLFVIHYVELRFFPVVIDFKITELKQDQTGILIRGTMHKVRDCEFIQITAYGDDQMPVRVQFLDSPDSATSTTREVGYQFWGPWRLINGEYEHIKFYARHQCHLLWQQSNKITDFVVLHKPAIGIKENP